MLWAICSQLSESSAWLSSFWLSFSGSGQLHRHKLVRLEVSRAAARARPHRPCCTEIQNVGDKQKIIHPITESLQMNLQKTLVIVLIRTAFWRCWRTLKSLVSPPARQILCTQDAEDWTAAPLLMYLDVSLCSDVDRWTLHSACRSTFSGGTCSALTFGLHDLAGTLLHCLGSNYSATLRSCAVLFLDFQHSMMHWTWSQSLVELLKELHNIHLWECSFSINIFPFPNVCNNCVSVKCCALGSGRSAKVARGRCPAQWFKMSAATLWIISSENLKTPAARA